MGRTHIEQVINVLSVLAVLFSNGLLLRAFHKVRSLRTPANLLLMNLAVVDLLFIASFALDIVSYTAMPSLLRLFRGKLFRMLNILVLLNLAAISIERLLAIKFSLRYVELVTKRRVKIAIAIIWIVSLVLNALPTLVKIVLNGGKDDGKGFEDFLASNRKAGNCSYQVPKRPRRMAFFLINILMLLLPYVITIVCHAWIFQIARQHYKRVMAEVESVSPQMSLQMKHAKTTAIVIGSFVLLFTPMFVLAVAKFIGIKRVCNPLPHKIAKILFSQSAWLNPVIYAWRNKDFRKAFSEILEPLYSRIPCCPNEDENEANPRVQNEERA